MQQFARELVELQPDLILSHNTPTTASLLRQTRTIPIVFVVVSDPVAAVSLQAFLGRAATSPVSPISSRRWLANGWSCSRRLRRALSGSPCCSTRQPPYAEYYLGPFKAAAASFALEMIAAPVRDTSELESVIAARHASRIVTRS
jgi:putative ABC transport system substrate-binding protein